MDETLKETTRKTAQRLFHTLPEGVGYEMTGARRRGRRVRRDQAE